MLRYIIRIMVGRRHRRANKMRNERLAPIHRSKGFERGKSDAELNESKVVQQDGSQGLYPNDFRTR